MFCNLFCEFLSEARSRFVRELQDDNFVLERNSCLASFSVRKNSVTVSLQAISTHVKLSEFT
ncbi:MAG: hypothetical protein ACRC62_23195 [Microcoleus sp.]